MNIITETASTVSEKKYKCPYCETRVIRKEMCHHIEKYHEELIPQDMTPMQVAFNTVNKKRENYGYCIMCHSHTKWNEDKARYDRLCESKKCHDDYVKLCADRLKKAKGITKQEMLSDPAFQDKMLKGRSISGTYKFSDGGTIGYVGSYEKNFLEFMDSVLKIKSEDIEGPGPIIEYMYKGKKHFWITDFLYKPYNIVFDIKDGGSNPNNRDMQEYREKQTAKEKAITKLGLYNYCRLTDNDFSQLLEIMLELKETLMELDGPKNVGQENYKPIIKINEDAMYSAINKYPVYIVLMHSGTGMSNVIKAVTGDEFSHACISFDPTLETMYSFGGKSLGSLDLGLTTMGKSNAFFEKFKAHYATYVMYLNKDQYDRMRARLQYFIDREPKLKYDFPSLIACALKIPTEFRKKYFCSRFVMDVIGAGIHIDKAPSLWTPQDITLLNNISKVNGGEDFRKYDPKVTKRNMEMIKKNRYDKIKISEAVYYNHDNMIMEGAVMSNKDIYYNKEKFDSGDINLCFIAGHSGSGKSTMAHNIEKNNDIEVYELDDVIANKLHFTLDNLKEYGQLIYSFFTGAGKKYYYTAEDVKNGVCKEIHNYDENLTKDFIKYSIQWANSHKNKKYILEGIWLYLYINPSQLSKYAVYIKGTSRLKSDLRAAKRDSSEEAKLSDRVKGYVGRAKNFFTSEARTSEVTLKKWRSYFSSIANESSQNETDLLYEKILETVLSEWGTGFNALPAVTQKPIYIINRMQNNVFSGIGYGDDYSLSKITVFKDDDNLSNETISQKIKDGEINVFKYIGSPENIVKNMYISIYNNSFSHDNYVKVYPEICSTADAVKEVTEYTMKADIARLNETTMQALSESFNLQIPQYENANFDCKRDINGVYIQNKITSMRSKSRETFDQIPTEVKKLVNIGYF